MWRGKTTQAGSRHQVKNPALSASAWCRNRNEEEHHKTNTNIHVQTSNNKQLNLQQDQSLSADSSRSQQRLKYILLYIYSRLSVAFCMMQANIALYRHFSIAPTLKAWADRGSGLPPWKITSGNRFSYKYWYMYGPHSREVIRIFWIRTRRTGFPWLIGTPSWITTIHSSRYPYILGQKRNAAYKTYIVYCTLYMGVFHQCLANDLTQFERWFLDYEFLGLC